MLKWLFGREGRPERTNHTLREQIDQLEEEAASAPDDARGQIYNRAGDLCARDSEQDAAKRFYGKSIDAYLKAGFYEPAAAMCRKLLRYDPDVVRAHSTLALLSVGNRLLGDAEREIDAYVDAARRTGTTKLAVPRLRLMGAATESEEIRLKIALLLEDLQDDKGSSQVLDQELGSSGMWGEAERWERLVAAALVDPDDLWKHS